MSAAFDVTSIRGRYQVLKAERRRAVLHPSFSIAEAEALRLADANPGCDFIITQEVARVTRAESKVDNGR